jgi:hypothetical protein
MIQKAIRRPLGVLNAELQRAEADLSPASHHAVAAAPHRLPSSTAARLDDNSPPRPQDLFSDEEREQYAQLQINEAIRKIVAAIRPLPVMDRIVALRAMLNVTEALRNG